MMIANAGIYGALLLSGLIGSLGHCLGMCGPLVLMVGMRLGKTSLAAWSSHLLYHAFRIVVYGVLGAIAGIAGSLLGLGGSLSSLAGAISLLLGIGVILFGLSYTGWLPLNKLAGAGPSWLSRAISQVLRREGRGRIPLLGALNGILPCGLVYSALLAAAGTGSPLRSAVGMLSFGFGTAPALLVIGMGAGALSVRARQFLARAAGILMTVVGLQLILRGLAALHALPHLKLGELMLW